MLIGMSQETLAELLGLTFQQVQKYEKGSNRMGAGRLWQVARILGVPIAWFYADVACDGAPVKDIACDSPRDVMEFLATGDGVQLSLAFMRIRDSAVRKRVLDLVECLAVNAPARG